jgi:hypothetical protein
MALGGGVYRSFRTMAICQSIEKYFNVLITWTYWKSSQVVPIPDSSQKGILSCLPLFGKPCYYLSDLVWTFLSFPCSLCGKKIFTVTILFFEKIIFVFFLVHKVPPYSLHYMILIKPYLSLKGLHYMALISWH